MNAHDNPRSRPTAGSKKRRSLWSSGEPFVWMTAGATAVSLLMVGGLLLLILSKGLGLFWPHRLVELTLADGSRLLGEVWQREAIPNPGDPTAPLKHRLRIKIGNRDLYGLDFRWVDEEAIADRRHPAEAVALERREWGNFYGYLREIEVDGRAIGAGQDRWQELQRYIADAAALYRRMRGIEKGDIGDINYEIEHVRLKMRRIELRQDTTQTRVQEELRALRQKIAQQQSRYQRKQAELKAISGKASRVTAIFTTADGRTKQIPVAKILRAYRPNRMGPAGKAQLYLSKLWEFLSDEPRESNTEGGIFPAIFGTVMMVFIMTLVVVPLGVIAAVYLREYARPGILVRLVRIAVNNLAGVPSIVYGVFGLGFFVYVVGGSIDRLFYPEALPSPTFGTGGILWASLTLALLTVPVVIVATEEGLSAVPTEVREGSLALSATKFETLWRIILPSATPGILTGVILAMARAAGEVAPLMITGVVKLAPSLPVDGRFPFLHLERKFMHLGFQIYDVGFQSPNVEAALPMLFATTLLLILIVVLLNLVAIWIRGRLRRRFRFATF